MAPSVSGNPADPGEAPQGRRPPGRYAAVDAVDGVDAADGACGYVYGDNGGVGRSPNPERPVGCLVSRTTLPLSRITHLSRTCGSLIDWRLLPLRS